MNSLKKIFKESRKTIKLNFSGGESELFLTLHYDYTMPDVITLTKDYEDFKRKLKKNFSNCKYITIVDNTDYGSFYLHVFLKSCDNKKLDISKDLLIKLWGQKNVSIQRINTKKDVKRLINYINPLTKHYSNITQTKNKIVSNNGGKNHENFNS